MNIKWRILVPIAVCVLGWSPGLAETDSASTVLRCNKSSLFLVPVDSPDYRKYAPDREVQLLHLALDVTPNFKERTIAAQASLRLKAVVRPAREIRLDAVDLRVSTVTASAAVQAWQATGDQIIVTLAEAIPPEKEVALTVRYSAEPTQGLYFRTPEMGYKAGDDHLFTQGEAIEARHWYPAIDTPNQQFTSEIVCRVPAGMTAISNGRLLSEVRDPATGLVAIHWSQEKRHANYLISLVAGYLKKLDDDCHGIPLAFYTPPSEINYAKTSFRGTKEMIQFFEEEIGVAYPWAKYDQVCVNDFVAGGMENTSATTLTDSTLFEEATENIRDSEGLVSHELSHQWFGDLVTCKDWSHLWLNEGFATYYETLWNARHHGRDHLVYELYHRARQITSMTEDNQPIVRRTYGEPGEMFGYLVYPKAGWVLHMLRCQLGEGLYRRCIKTYLERHLYGNVVTDDLRSVLEELSGRSFDQFFDQWLYHGRFPDLDIGYSWDETAKVAKISVQQTQPVNADVLLFRVPLTIRFKSKTGTRDEVIQVVRKQEDFYFPLAAAPELVRVDPEYTLLARINFNPPATMLDAQLADQHDVMGRLLAVDRLSHRSDHDSVAKLKNTLNTDPFYGVRVEAAHALRGLHNEEALSVLLSSGTQADARVRQAVVDGIAGFYDERAYGFACQVVEEEKNPDIVCTALRSLGGYSKPEIHDVLVRRLNSDSFRNEVADAAVSAMRSQDDPGYIAPLLDAMAKREPAFTTHGFAQSLSALAYLARNELNKDQVREFLVAQVNHKKRTVQLAALAALGTLGDPKAIAVLEKFATADKNSPQRSAAEKSVAALRERRKPVDDFKNLRQEVSDLRKSNHDLRKDLDDLQKKVEMRAAEAKTEAPGTVKKGKPEPKGVEKTTSPAKVESPKSK
ncbi:MAG TPA: M1 family metallopeptidase [Verrucomicrobiae bacterium]